MNTQHKSIYVKLHINRRAWLPQFKARTGQRLLQALGRTLRQEIHHYHNEPRLLRLVRSLSKKIPG